MVTDRRKPDLARIKRAVSLPQLMTRYGFQLKTQPGNSLRGKCPLPTHTNEKDNNSFTATLKDTGWVWDCFSTSCIANRSGRKGGNILEFVMLMENDTSLYRTGHKLNDWFGLNAWLLTGRGSPIPGGRGGNAPRSPKEPEPPPAPPPETPQAPTQTGCERNEPLTFQLRHIDFTHPYLKERGVTAETAEHFGVGYFGGNSKLLKGRIVFPIWSAKGQGNPVAYAGRAIDGGEPKYVFPPGFKKSLELFNLNRVPEQADTVIIVEGFFSVLWLHQAGFPNVVALMGSSLSEAQHALLLSFPRVILFLDGDEAGRGATREIGTRLMYSHFVKAISLAAGIQPDSLAPKTIKQLLG